MDGEEKKYKVFAYLKAVEENHACIVENYRAAATSAGLTPGQFRAGLYLLCGEGIILQEGSRILLLKERIC